MDRYIGQLLDGRYEILDVIGTGGMAVVYKARCRRLNRLVAIKVLKDENLDDEDFLRRFHAESRVVAMLNHPNIVSVFDVSTDREQDYIVMELIDSLTLKQYIENQGRLHWRAAVHFATQIAKALEHAHSRKLVHRDIKPHNVMVLKNGTVKVTDFGIARMMENNNTMTKEAIGSVHYISPEQAKGRRVDARSDLYSLGVVMYEMVTGKTPFDGESAVAVAIKHINGGAPSPSEINPYIPRGLEQIIIRAMARDVENRYGSASEMIRDLEALSANPSLEFPEYYDGRHYRQPGLAVAENLPEEGSRPERVVRQSSGETSRKVAVLEDNAEEDSYSTKGKTAVAAVVICSLVAIVAIIVFMILLTQNDILAVNQDAQTPKGDAQLSQNLQLPATQPTESQKPTEGQLSIKAPIPEPPESSATRPQVVRVQMTTLVNRPRQEAELQLQALGLKNVTWVDQESFEPAGTVIGQSVAPEQWVATDTPLVIVCAAGAVTKTCTFDLPFQTEEFYLSLFLDGRPAVAERLMEPFCATATFQLTGKGRQNCEIYINGKLYQTLMVDFEAYAG